MELLDFFLAVTSTVWGVFGVYYIVYGNAEAAQVCIAGSVSTISLLICLQRHVVAAATLAHTFVGASIGVLFALAIVTGREYSLATLFFPIVAIMATQLLGIRSAAIWSAAMVLVTVVHHFFPWWSVQSPPPSLIDKFVNNVVMILMVLWLAVQTESFFDGRIRGLSRLTRSLQEKTRLLELAEETASVGHWRWDVRIDAFTLSSEALKICRPDQDRAAIATIEEFISVWDEEDRVALREGLFAGRDDCQAFETELSFRSTNGLRYVSCRALCESNSSGEVIAVFGTLRDDTDLRRATDRLSRKAEQLNKLASYDPLTGLTNRFQFQQQLGSITQRAVRTNSQMALMVLDMDGFKEINDTLGHQTGDEVLKEVAVRLRQIIRAGDVISRLGGDEFTIILRNAIDETEVHAVARRVVDTIRRPMHIDGQELHVGVSIGASLCPADTERADELFTFADTAMYDAKVSKAGLALYHPGMTEALRTRRDAESRLAGALGRDEFRVVFQPQAALPSGEIMGFESLLRWKQDGAEVSPLQFIPLLESNGQISQVGQWVLEQSCEQVARWHSQGYMIRSAINISPIQFRQPDFADQIIKTISRYGVDPGYIELEITEGLLIQDLENTADKLFRLKAFGTQISVDDFGTGYSSLAYLKHLPIDQLKIDRTFIKDIPEFDDGTIASSIIVLAQSLDMKVLAEGVETIEQLDFLKSQDCHAWQGNYLGKPMTADQCDAFLEQQHRSETRGEFWTLAPL